MSFITGVLYAALLAYLGGWYVGQWQGNFSLLLLMLTPREWIWPCLGSVDADVLGTSFD